jgi:ABC-type antimicrobial peptide transport system permease subunit
MSNDGEGNSSDKVEASWLDEEGRELLGLLRSIAYDLLLAAAVLGGLALLNAFIEALPYKSEKVTHSIEEFHEWGAIATFGIAATRTVLKIFIRSVRGVWKTIREHV